MGIMEKKMEISLFGIYIYICIYPIGPFLGTLNIRCRIIIGTQNGTIILTTTLMVLSRPYRLHGHTLVSETHLRAKTSQNRVPEFQGP